MEPTAVSIFTRLEQMVEADHNVEFPATVVSEMEQDGLKTSELARIVAPQDRILKLVENDQPLPPDLADRVSRIARIVSLAEKVFGNRQKAFLWMRAPNDDVGGVTPIELLEREAGARRVEDTLMRIEYSIFA